MTMNECGVSFWDNKKCSKIDYGDDFTILWITKNHCIIHFKWVSYISKKLLKKLGLQRKGNDSMI